MTHSKGVSGSASMVCRVPFTFRSNAIPCLLWISPNCSRRIGVWTTTKARDTPSSFRRIRHKTDDEVLGTHVAYLHALLGPQACCVLRRIQKNSPRLRRLGRAAA